MSNNTTKRKRKQMTKQPKQRQKQKIIQLTPEENQDRKRLIALVLVEELKQNKDASDTTARSIIVKRAKEYARYCDPVSKVARELWKEISKSKICKRANFYRALQSPEFEQFKDMQNSRNASGKHSFRSTSRTKVPNSSPVVETETKPGTYAKPIPSSTTTTEQTIPQHTLDARKAIDESNEIQSGLGKIVKLLSGELTEEQRSKRDDEDIGKSTQRKLVEQSRDHLRLLVKRIPDGHFRSIEVSIGWASLLIEQFEEAITNEAIIRKRTESMSGV